MDVKYYLYHFARLHTARYKGKAAPHKAVLLLAVINLVERGSISSPVVELSDELVNEFKSLWKEKLPPSCPFTCDISKPYFHMQHEPFWHLLEREEELNMVAEELGLYSSETKTMAKAYTVNAMREKFQCARRDSNLLEIMQNADDRKQLEDLLITKYLTYNPPSDKKRYMTAMIAALFLAA